MPPDECYRFDPGGSTYGVPSGDGPGPGLGADVSSLIGGPTGVGPGCATAALPLRSIRTFGIVRSNGREPAQAEPIRQDREASRNNRIFALEQKTRSD